MRRLALLVALVMAALVGAVPVTSAQAADAPVPLESLWNLSDIKQSAQYTPYSSLPPSPDNQIGDTWYDESNRDLSSSADGSRVGYVRTRTNYQEVVLRDRSGLHPRVVWSWKADPAYPPSSAVHLGTPVLAPNGERMAFWYQVGPWGQYGSTSECRAQDVDAAPYLNGGAAGCRPLAWIDQEHLMVQTPGGWNQVRRCTFVCSGPSTVSGLPKGVDAVTVGAAGTRIAWVEDGQLSVGQLAKLPSEAWEVTEARVLAPRVPQDEPGWTQVNVEPAFSRDGDDVLWVQRVDPSGNGSIVTRPFDGSSPATVVSAATSSRDHADVAPTWGDDQPPGAVTPGSFALGGTRAAATWTLPADSDLSGVLVTLTPPGGTPLQRYAPRGAFGYGFSGLKLRTTYDVDLQAVDRSGLTGPVTHKKFTALDVMGVVPHVASSVSTTADFPVTLGTPDVPGATYDGAWREGLYGTGQQWNHWVTGSSNPVQRVPAQPGKDYSVSARAHDAYGNTTGWRGSCCTAVPLDQTAATFVGGATSQRAGSWLGSVHTLRRTTDSARLTLSDGRLLVIGSTCGTCGVLRVYVDGRLVKSVDTWSRVTYLRRWLARVTFTTAGPHVVTLVPAGTRGRPDVVLDGFTTSSYAY